MIQYGMPTLIENRTLQENIDLCSRLGLRFIELNMNFPEYQVDRLEKTDLFLDAADAAGIYYTIHLDENLNIADFNRLVTDAYLETVRRTIEVAKCLLPLRDRYGDASQPLTINMHMHHGIFITLPDRKVQMYDRDKDRYLEDCRRFRDLCGSWIGDAPILITVENTDGFRGYEQEAIDLFLESPRFGLTWDIGHSKAVGEKDVPFILSRQDRLGKPPLPVRTGNQDDRSPDPLCRMACRSVNDKTFIRRAPPGARFAALFSVSDGVQDPVRHPGGHQAEFLAHMRFFSVQNAPAQLLRLQGIVVRRADGFCLRHAVPDNCIRNLSALVELHGRDDLPFRSEGAETVLPSRNQQHPAVDLGHRPVFIDQHS